MNRIAVAAACLCASMAFAQAPTKTSDAPKAGMKTGETMGFMPRKVTHEDKKGIEETLTQTEAAWKKGDLAATASMVDFPVFMVTDDSKGMVMTETWTKEKYMTEMSDAMKMMPKDVKVKHNRKFDFLTDDMAIVYDNATMTMGKKSMNVRSAELFIKKDGKWMVKSMMEGGWGDTMKSKTTASETKG